MSIYFILSGIFYVVLACLDRATDVKQGELDQEEIDTSKEKYRAKREQDTLFALNQDFTTDYLQAERTLNYSEQDEPIPVIDTDKYV